MKNISLIALFSFFIIIETISCNNGGIPSKSSVNLEKEIAFRNFLKKFQVLSLPAIIPVGTEAPKGLPKAQQNSGDSSFIKPGDGSNNSSICYGVLPDTTRFFMLIWEYPGNWYVPILSIYTKDGNKVSEKVINVGDCAGNEMVAGSGTCTNCINTVLIRKDYSLYASDSVISNKCDSSGNIVPGTTQIQLMFINGKITQEGAIEFTKQQNEKIR